MLGLMLTLLLSVVALIGDSDVVRAHDTEMTYTPMCSHASCNEIDPTVITISRAAGGTIRRLP